MGVIEAIQPNGIARSTTMESIITINGGLHNRKEITGQFILCENFRNYTPSEKETRRLC
ncbi:hypothetical protein NVP1244A_026 [Vibrio phage 1.244.A._10N.261.54.C3]|nr:hypothetical protein NVP1244A_026 [Vibrio phage 1.244.A._10N.261.54.C3]AUR98654.1 hypothetical protein NVP1255O_026 [Vibrio phage 1.255.O._10N.286.45.F1]